MTSTRGRRDSGFALIMALWAVGLVGLVGMAYVASARTRVAAAGAASEHARLALAAEGAAARAALQLVAELTGERSALPLPSLDGTPRACRAGEDVVALVGIEDEAGKVNLNLAPPALLAAVLAAAGSPPDEAGAIVAGLLAARDRAAAAPPPEAPRQDGRRREERRSITQLRAVRSAYEVGAFTPPGDALLPALLPLVTAHSNRIGIDPGVASPALLEALGGGARSGGLPAAWIAPSERRAFTVRAAAASPRAVARIDIVAELGIPPAPPLRIVEVRRDPSPVRAAGWPSPSGLPPC
ncbi:hypothetical protein [Alsobacter sp. R-9]